LPRIPPRGLACWVTRVAHLQSLAADGKSFIDPRKNRSKPTLGRCLRPAQACADTPEGLQKTCRRQRGVMRAGAATGSGLVHATIGSVANGRDVTQTAARLRGSSEFGLSC